MTEKSQRPIPVGVSAHHCHVTREHLDILFGKGYELTVLRPLKQPGQYAAVETVTVKTDRHEIPGIRILGPVRRHTQVELSLTEARRLGVVVPVRQSAPGGGSGAVIAGPEGAVNVSDEMIAARRHIHMTPADAAEFGVFDRQTVSVKVIGERAVVFDDVLVRVNPDYSLQFHVDTDEANAAGLRTGDQVIMLHPFRVR